MPSAAARPGLLSGVCGRLRGVSAMPRTGRLAALLCAALTTLLLAAPPALGSSGEGLAGRVSDKTITFFSFGVIAFFALLVIVLSLIQSRLERRKERRRLDLERLG